MIDATVLLRSFVFASALLYVLADWRDRRRLQDEREQLIKLKAGTVVQNLSVAVVVCATVYYMHNPRVDAIYLIVAVAGSLIYGNLLGSWWYRRRL